MGKLPEFGLGEDTYHACFLFWIRIVVRYEAPQAVDILIQRIIASWELELSDILV